MSRWFNSQQLQRYDKVVIAHKKMVPGIFYLAPWKM